MPINIAIIGASGYTGAELIRILLLHPHAAIKILTGDSSAGKNVEDIYPHLRNRGLPKLTALEKTDFSSIDLAFCCLPHGTTQTVIANLPKHLKIIDLSADFRLADPAVYKEWYGHTHQAVKLQKEAVYGLTEVARAEIKKARLVANPGCYPTSAAVPLVPLLKAKAILPGSIIVDAKSGVTGAGRKVAQNMLFAEIDGGINAYGVGAHRHAPEIDQNLSRAAGKKIIATFTPHLVPMNRGILSTIYVQLAGKYTVTGLRAILLKAYEHEPFVQILPLGLAPSTHQVRGTNNCAVGVFADRAPGRAILVSAIDNLVKGASGQAVQNMNVMFGWPETTGLQLSAVFP
ncbi:MAG: N-acetyl-gamma-glutamyl-phosphate reductase [Pseudomonadota bacterium]|nr:N-acetyl-gamma-glutamyl-phosphate reductase [Pseudomonadota bacterium]MDE3037491.1 N-acetyl-gamma-glutamyl-phosphate reductase [Pseudomonadota bacterium]